MFITVLLSLNINILFCDQSYFLNVINIKQFYSFLVNFLNLYTIVIYLELIYNLY